MIGNLNTYFPPYLRVLVSVAIWVACFLTGCGITQKPVIRDSTVIHHTYVDVIRDSVVVVPVEKVVNVVKTYDTLRMETSLAVAKAWADTTMGMLRGEMRNKKDFQTKIVYRVIVKKDTVFRFKEVPVEVTKVKYRTPKIVAFLACLGILLVVYLGMRLWKRFM